MTDTPTTGSQDERAASPLATAPDLAGRVVAVTGANGFVGARTCALLAAAGASVRALVRRAGAAPGGERVEEVVTDLDADDLAEHLRGTDVVVHTAATAGSDLEAARAVNVDGTRAVLAAARAAAVDRVVHVSTTSVIAADDEVVDEDAPVVGDDASPYAVTKRQAEEVVAEAAAAGSRTVVLRPPAVLGWGPTSTWGQRVPAWVRDGEMPIPFDERDTFAWVHVDDLAAAVALAATSDEAIGRTYLVVSGTVGATAYLDEVRSWFPDAPSPYTPADEPPPARTVSTARIERELGWRPTVDFGTAMAESAARHR